jgi:hypothetical protein
MPNNTSSFAQWHTSSCGIEHHSHNTTSLPTMSWRPLKRALRAIPHRNKVLVASPYMLYSMYTQLFIDASIDIDTDGRDWVSVKNTGIHPIFIRSAAMDNGNIRDKVPMSLKRKLAAPIDPTEVVLQPRERLSLLKFNDRLTPTEMVKLSKAVGGAYVEVEYTPHAQVFPFSGLVWAPTALQNYQLPRPSFFCLERISPEIVDFMKTWARYQP